MKPDELLASIAARYGKPVRPNGINIPCPAHGGDDPNLHVWVSKGRLALHCFSHGCHPREIMAALGVADDDRTPRPVDLEAKRREEQREADRHAEAARRTTELMRASTYSTHPYLERKGFPDEHGLVVPGRRAALFFHDDTFTVDQLDAGFLLVPIRHARTGAVQSCELIAHDGLKKFLPGGRLNDGVYRMEPRSGPVRYVFYCEGYATGLSIKHAMNLLYERMVQVVVTFSARGVANMARPGRHSFVIADHDLHICPPPCRHRWGAPYDADRCPACGNTERLLKPTGERYARQVYAQHGLRWWKPPDPDTDANDYAVQYGTRALADVLHGLTAALVPR